MLEIITQNLDGIFEIKLNRPEKRNALNDQLIADLKSALRSIEQDNSIFAVIISAAGKDFCSGADLSALQKIAESDVAENLEDARSLMELFVQLRKLRVPVIASVQGRALAGGCGLATACDVVIATETSRFGYPEVKIGFVPAMVMAILRRNLSEKRAFELITKGFEFDAETALNFGLINKIVPEEELLTATQNYAADYKKLSRSAVTLSKRLLYQMDSMSFETAMETGAEINAIARVTEDCKNGVNKFLDRS